MTFYAVLLQVGKQFTHHWLRLTLASLGILVGVWSIALTTSLSLSASDTIVTAINSQPQARSFSLRQTNSSGEGFDLDEEVTALSLAEVETLVSDYASLEQAFPSVQTSVFVPNLSTNRECANAEQTLRTQLESGQILPSEITRNREELTKDCPQTTVSFTPLASAVEEFRDAWVGQTDELSAGEIAVCFACNSQNPLFEILEAKTPSELLGRELVIELSEFLPAYTPGENVETFNPKQPTPVSELTRRTFTIAAVLDDRELENANRGGNPNNVFYLPLSAYPQFLENQREISELGFLNFDARVTSFEELEPLLEDLETAGYNPSTGILSLIQGVTSLFYGAAVVLGLFGIVALIASMFGIINVMTISVLRRQKEIGILKALGAKSRSIFTLFLLESALLGVIGWAIGLLVTWFSLLIVSRLYDTFVLGNDAWAENLENLNLTSFNPTLPLFVAGLTLLVAVGFTVISGLVPSLRAARKNPVDVLR